MKTPLIATLLLLTHAAAATTFVIGNEPFELEFETNPTNEVFRAFVAADVSRVFAPLGSISNVVDIASLQQHPEMSRGLTFREWYPEGFSGAWSVTNRNGTFVFRMDLSLSDRYMEAFNGYHSFSNRFAGLHEMMQAINDGTVTNWTDSQIQSSVFVPEGSSFSFAAETARTFFHDMSQSGPFTVSVLDNTTATIRGFPFPIAVAKTSVQDETGLRFVPVTWIFNGERWMFLHPAAAENSSP